MLILKLLNYKSSWQIINGHKYYFNTEEYALISWQEIDGKRYYSEPKLGHNLEYTIYVFDESGVQVVSVLIDNVCIIEIPISELNMYKIGTWVVFYVLFILIL